ncbi:MAG: DNA mismatch repair endonuclease MutL [Sandaracinaceae bacterium]|nr:DNA mismatch repair endonuclease MutL [Sandaracinaceae bacterium]
MAPADPEPTSRPRVRALPSALVDQIAAGEVVERPASVVKELVENAIDAGAREIRVETEQGGIARIVVSDDGHGMDRDDAELAVSRHATSKIATLADLQAIGTLGFRGEALPSIASVSRFSLRTRPHDAVEGVEIRIEGGTPHGTSVAGGSPGTTVRVDDLFYNVPARRKFLKGLATESAHVGETLARLALSRPALRLSWTRDGRRVREWASARDGYQRALQLFADEKLAAVEGERDGVRVRAMLSAAERARTGAGQLYVSVNGRVVRDRTLARAVAFSFGSTLPPGRFPAGVVWVELDPERVDVNVHPQKAEVRFADARVVLDGITRILAAGLGQSPFRRRESPRAQAAPLLDPLEPIEPLEPDASEPPPAPDEVAAREGSWTTRESAASPYVPSMEPTEGMVAEGALGSPRAEHAADAYLGLRVLGQLARTYLVCEGPRGLVVIDQHAADERVKFARLATAHRDGVVEIQRLLIPERVELSEREAAILSEQERLLLSLGLEARLFGERTALVSGTPALLGRSAPERLLRDALAELSSQGSRAFGDAIDTALATMACHGAIRAGDVLSPAEQRALLTSLASVASFAGHCPHGRPILHAVSLDELARRVGRT